MGIELILDELPAPRLQFGGAVGETDPKLGLEAAGPFDLRFGGARKTSIAVGLVGTQDTITLAEKWLNRVRRGVPGPSPPSPLNRSFPPFEGVFRKSLENVDSMTCEVSEDDLATLVKRMGTNSKYEAFQEIVDLFAAPLESLAKRDANRPDVVVLCLPKCVLASARSVERDLTSNERQAVQALSKNQSERQLELFDLHDDVEQTEEDLLRRDFRDAIKARALQVRLPIQIGTPALFEDSDRSQDPATRAWNFSVALYYKAGGVPWRLPVTGPETCFVGVSFHHFRTTQRHLVNSSLAQAFSSEGEGFAIRGEGVPADLYQSLNTKLSRSQAATLGKRVLSEYEARTGSAPLRMVVHKTSIFSDDEAAGFREAFKDIPVVSMVTLIPSHFRLLRFGSYPVNVGTTCTVNSARTYLYTTGFMPSLGTYPGPHVPQPFEIRCFGDYSAEEAVGDVYNLSRMNWNSADMRAKWPVTLSFARRVGGILDEYGDESPTESSLRYFI